MLPTEPRFATNDIGSHQHERALDHGAEILDLLVPVRMIGIRRLLAEPDRAQSAKRRDDIDDRFQRIGIEGNAASQPIRGGFHGEDDNADPQAAPGNLKAAAHNLSLYGPKKRVT